MSTKVEAPLTRRDALWILIAIGLIGGAVRIAGLAFAGVALRKYVLQGIHVLWTAPIGSVLLTLIWGLAIWFLGRIATPLRRPRIFVAVAGWLPIFSLTSNFISIHPAAAALLAAGIASIATRLSPRMFAGAMALKRRVAVTGALYCALAFIVLVVAAPAIEQWRTSRHARPPAGAPNLLLIVLDTVREKSLGMGAHGLATSPFLDGLGRAGIRFTQAFATAPWTTPSHGSMMTGLWPTQLGVTWDRTLDRSPTTVAEVLRNAGYLTAGFVANVQNTGLSSGVGRGFTHYEDYTANAWTVVRGSRIGERILQSAWLRNALGSLSEPDRKRSPQVSADFLRWLDRQEDRPFFAFLNYFDAHDPYEASPHVDARFGVADDVRDAGAKLEQQDWTDALTDIALRHYEAAIAEQDDQLGRLFAELDRRGALANTMVIVTSDHGEEFHEHGVMYHANSVYRAGLQVPLVVWYPARIAGGRRISTPVSIRSIAATLTALVPGLPAALFPGPSLLDIAGDAARGEPVFSMVHAVPTQPASFPVHNGPLYALVDQGVRYIVNGLGAEELYQLTDDEEATNLAEDPAWADTLAGLRRTLDALVHGSNDRRP